MYLYFVSFHLICIILTTQVAALLAICFDEFIWWTWSGKECEKEAACRKVNAIYQRIKKNKS